VLLVLTIHRVLLARDRYDGGLECMMFPHSASSSSVAETGVHLHLHVLLL